MKIQFEKVTSTHLDAIFSWLAEPHVIEFWGNTQAHKDDIVNFTEGRKTPSSYAGGQYVYWVASLEHEPFAMLMTIQETAKEDMSPKKLKMLSELGNTYSLDYMIGNPKFLGKGYGPQTLYNFINFFRESTDPKADSFFIDLASDNLKAKHVCMKVGFRIVSDVTTEGDVSGTGKVHHLLIKEFNPKVSIIKATIDDYSIIQNIPGFHSVEKRYDLKSYFENPREIYLVKAYDELAGFVMLHELDKNSEGDIWRSVAEFCIIAKFRRWNVAHQVGKKILDIYPDRTGDMLITTLE